jgi:hypothetical protein
MYSWGRVRVGEIITPSSPSPASRGRKHKVICPSAGEGIYSILSLPLLCTHEGG